jgi:hypothetical protein
VEKLLKMGLKCIMSTFKEGEIQCPYRMAAAVYKYGKIKSRTFKKLDRIKEGINELLPA